MKPYEGGEPYIFVSYARKDRDRVFPLLDALYEKGYRIWRDEGGISLGDEWMETIEEHIDHAAVCLVFWSKSSAVSRHCRAETGEMLAEEKVIVPVFLDDTPVRKGLRMYLRQFQSVKLASFDNNAAFIEYLEQEKNLAPCKGVSEPPAPQNTQTPPVPQNKDTINFVHSGIAGDDESIKEDGSMELASPMTGRLMPLEDIPDPTFASGVLGEGIAIVPSDGHVTAPCDAAVSSVSLTNHAICLEADNGMVIYIHVGLDTVSLNGKFFTCRVKENQKVKKGDLLLTADLNAIRKAGYELYTPVLIANSDDYTEIVSVSSSEVRAGETILMVR